MAPHFLLICLNHPLFQWVWNPKVSHQNKQNKPHLPKIMEQCLFKKKIWITLEQHQYFLTDETTQAFFTLFWVCETKFFIDIREKKNAIVRTFKKRKSHRSYIFKSSVQHLFLFVHKDEHSKNSNCLYQILIRKSLLFLSYSNKSKDTFWKTLFETALFETTKNIWSFVDE